MSEKRRKINEVPLLTERCLEKVSALDYVQKDRTENFSKVFSRYYDELRLLGISGERLEHLTGITSSSLSHYAHKDATPEIDTLIALCICMRLYYPRAMYLMTLSSHSINLNDEKYRICEKYLMGCGFNKEITVTACNEELEKYGHKPLTKMKKYD
jgi:transcriptional regulator with XRE-family HTH domain